MHTDIDQQTQAVAGRLRQLPAELLPPYDWQEFRRRAAGAAPAVRPERIRHREHSAARSSRGPSWLGAALAAGLVVTLFAVVVWSRLNTAVPQTARTHFAVGDPRSLGRAVRETPLEEATASPAVESAGPADDSLQAADPSGRAVRSRAIETWLAALPQEPAVVRVGTRAAVAGLEDQLAQVDDLLSTVRLDGAGHQYLTALQQQRARLMGSLAQVRYAEAVDAESP